MDGVGTTQTTATARPHLRRAHLLLLLAVCLVLPVAVLTLAPHGGPMATDVEAAATVPSSAPSTTARPTTSKAATTSESEESTTTTEATTSSSAPSTTEAPASTSTAPKAALKAQAAPSTTAAPVTTTTAKPATTTTTAKPTTTTAAAPVASSSDAAFLACVRQRESGGNYAIVSAGGTYRGAYQFLQSTWDNAAASAGRSDLVGVPVNLVAPADQDAIALWVVQHWGRSPWGGVCY